MANGEFGGGDGTGTYPYLVEDAEDLNAVRDGLSLHYLQTSDIDLSSWGNWIPIGGSGGDSASGTTNAFNGSYDGGGYQIKNMTCEHPSKKNVGLFGRTTSATLTRVSVVSFTVKGKARVGAVSGSSQGTFIDCNSSGLVKGVNYVGGIVGYLFNGSLTGCSSSGAIEGSTNVGGVAGDGSNSVLIDCNSTCDIIGFDSAVGGIIGDGLARISNCYSTGDVSGSKLVGGISGSRSTLITNCHSTGDITGTDYVGGICGGVVGNYSDLRPVENSYSTGDISGRHYVGGIVGRGGPCTNCYSSGVILGEGFVAGISGSHNPRITVQNTGCYSLNPIIYRLPGSTLLSFGDIIGNTIDDDNRPSNCYSLDTLEFRQL